MSQENATARQLVIIDSRVNDWQNLANGVNPDTAVLILDSSADGLTQINDYLTAWSAQNPVPFQSVHIISHGNTGSLLLGSSTVTSSNVDLYTKQLAALGNALTENGDILLYGCNVAADQSGLQFINRFAALTGADVAASNDITGASALGGDWQLEASVGTIDSSLAMNTVTLNAYTDILIADTVVDLDETDEQLNPQGNLDSVDEFGTPVEYVNQNLTPGQYGNFSVNSFGGWDYIAYAAYNELNDGDTYTDVFTVETTNGAQSTVTINIHGTHDAVDTTISPDVADLDETDEALSTDGTLVSVDEFGSPVSFVPQDGEAGQYGIFNIDSFGAWTYLANSAYDELNPGDTYSDVFTVENAVGTQSTVTINIHGTTESGDLATNPVVVDLDETDEALGTDGILGGVDEFGSPVSFIPQVSEQGQYGIFYISSAGEWTYFANSAYDELSPGDTYSDIFTVQITNGTQTTLTINIHGTDESLGGGATINPVVVDLDETDEALSTEGLLEGVDELGSPVSFVPQTGTEGSYGVFNIDSEGEWTYFANSAYDELNPGDTYSDIFTVESADGTQSTVTININGTDEEDNTTVTINPVVVDLDETDEALSTDGLLEGADEFGFPISVSFVPQDGTEGLYGFFSIGSDGTWSYYANSAYDELNPGDTYSDIFTVESADGTQSTVTININGTTDNVAPTLTAFSSAVAGGNEDSVITTTFANLQSRGDEEDVDGTVTAFVVKGVSTGTLKIGASLAAATPWDETSNNSVDAAHQAYWTPAANANGTLNMFTVVAEDDGGLQSDPAIQARAAVTAVNDAPTLTAFSSAVTGGNEDSVITTTFANLQSRGNDTDVDGTVTAFVVKAVSTGTLKIGTSAAAATAWNATTNNTVDAAHQAYWTPAANANGTLNMFTVVAKDNGGLQSAPAIQATAAVTAVNDAPTGTVVINDTTPQQNQILTASNTLADVDGLGTITYSWLANGVAAGTGSTHTVTAGEIGKTLRVVAAYTDQDSYAESVSSAATSPVTSTTPGITMQLVSTNSNTSEGNAIVDNTPGNTVRYSVILNKAPVADHSVTLNFRSSDTTEGTVTPSLTFTSRNWNQAQTLVISGVDDLLDDGDIAYTITPTVNQAATNALEYKTIAIRTVSMLNIDDAEDTPINDSTSGNIGTSGVDYMHGSNGDDQLYGGYGYDELRGGYGADELYGEQGNDSLYGEMGSDTLYGGYQNDSLYGGADNDTLWGEAGLDRLEGGVGNDTLDGGIGADTLIGGAGNDTYYLGYDAVDIINDNGLLTDVDTVIMPYQMTSYTLPVSIEKGTIAPGTQASSLTGNDGANTLTGNDGANTLDGGVGTDTLVGGSGNDIYVVDVSSDVVTESSLSGGTDTVQAKASYTLRDNLENLTLTGTSVIDGTGNNGNNTLSGNTANNKLDGGVGNDNLNSGAGVDILIGGLGKDTLAGGLGADKFKFSAATESGNTAATADIISDFNRVQGDKIDLSGIDANSVTNLNNTFSAPTVGVRFSGTFTAQGQLYFDITAHILYGNNDTDNTADFAIQLTAVSNLGAGDFIL